VTIIDLVVLAVLALSMLLAFSRGFIREALSIASWVGAIVAALYLYEPVGALLAPYISQEFIRLLAGGLIVLVAVLIVLSFITHAIAEAVRDSQLSFIDRSVGVVFGAVRGLALVSLAYLLVTMLWPEREHPDWLAQSRTLPVLRVGANTIATLLPEKLRAAAQIEIDGARSQLENARDLQRLANPQAAPAQQGEKGYAPDASSDIDKFLTDAPRTP
jgi:membrane protein required for colicin V production